MEANHNDINEFLNQLAGIIGIGLWFVSIDRKSFYINNWFYKHGLEKIVKRTIDEDHIPEISYEDMTNMRTHFNYALKGLSGNYHTSINLPTGFIHLQTWYFPLMKDGEITGVGGYCKDVTEEHEIIMELKNWQVQKELH